MKDVYLDWHHVDAVYRAGLDAEFTAGALRFDDGMHLLGGAEYGIHWAGLDAESATDADVFPDDGNSLGFFFPNLVIQWNRFAAEQIGQRNNGGLTAGWAAVDLGLTISNGLGIGTTTGVTALAALGLRQDSVDLIRQRITLNLEAYRGKAEQQAKDDRQSGKGKYSSQHC